MGHVSGLQAESEPDCIDWMLSSPRVMDEQLIQELVQVCFQPVYRSALAKWKDPSKARRSACAALAQAAHQRHRYWGDMPLQAWFQGFIKEPKESGQKAVEAASPESGEPEELDATQIQAEVELALGKLRQRARRVMGWRRGILAGAGAAVVLALLWLAGISQLLPSLLTESRVAFNYPYITEPGDTLRSISKMAGVSMREISPKLAYAADDPLAPGSSLWIPAYRPAWWQGLFKSRPVKLPPALSLQSTQEEIRQRMLESARYWQTLWADQVTVFYEPAGIIAPPVWAWRSQVWVRRTGEGVRLIGGLDGSSVFEALYYDGNRVYQKDSPGYITLTRFIQADAQEEGQGFFSLPFEPPATAKSWALKPVGMETVGGRQSLVVDRFDEQGLRQGRYWIDASLGVILAQRVYAPVDSGSDRQPVLRDTSLTEVQFNVPISDAIVDPNNYVTQLAKGPGGEPLDRYQVIPLPHLKYAINPVESAFNDQPAPAGFDPTHSRLTLRLLAVPGDDPTEPVELNYGEYQRTHTLELYADDYYLGNTTLQLSEDYDSGTFEGLVQRLQPQPACTRSSDGRQVALQLAGHGTYLYWLSLSNPAEIHTLPERWYSKGVFAFSPSGKQLAFYGCHSGEVTTDCGISVMDISNGQPGPLIELEGEDEAVALAWSPDGSSLAVATLKYYSNQLVTASYLNVYQASTGNLTYTGNYDLHTYQTALDSPMHSWEKSFQAQLVRAKGCALP